ncbi:Serine/threonine-protein phosphatase PP2A catalytic subunit [Orchesella cincta]|uniref:Serine/threonine-protein phosphatase n=1 Tax=Orchesella cincta TaxID=48709 RepID=A0A1D2NMV7_ORCCI|nr:Serine/threonine-protein phosphatase PP2A catalytic subunit [Orchesella cincta]
MEVNAGEGSSQGLNAKTGQPGSKGKGTELDEWIERLLDSKPLLERDVERLCKMAKVIFAEEPNIVEVKTPVTVCGDIHGQYKDLLRIFQMGGSVPETNYLFLGDYVDRGKNSVATISLLVALKVRHKHRITMLRGNHESRQISRNFGFYNECMKRYKNANVWTHFTQLFDFFPISALIDGSIFCLHGGLSPSISTLDEVRNIKRDMEVPLCGPFHELLWTDPGNNLGWGKNLERGENALAFGADITEKFTTDNGLSLIARAHQVKMEGYEFTHQDKLVTVFSAPNYCKVRNKAAFIKFAGDYRSVKQFTAVGALEEVEIDLTSQFKCDDLIMQLSSIVI